MQSDAPIYTVGAMIVLLFASLTGAASTYASFASGSSLNSAWIVLALLGFSWVVFLIVKLSSIIHELRRSDDFSDRVHAYAMILTMVCGVAGSVILAGLSSTSNANTDPKNDGLIYLGAFILGISCLVTLVAGVFYSLKQSRNTD